jgi:hypothetical protein
MSVYVGIDVHRKRSQVAVVTEDGMVQLNKNVVNGSTPMLLLIGELPSGTPVAFEAAFGWSWLADLLEDYGFEAHLMHPLRCKAIASARLKNVHPAQLSVLPLQRPDPRRIRRRRPRPQATVDLRLLGPAAQRVRLDPQLAAHLPASRRHAGVLILDQVQHQPDRPVTQLVRILPCCSHRPTLPWIGSLHKTRGDSRHQRAAA